MSDQGATALAKRWHEDCRTKEHGADEHVVRVTKAIGPTGLFIPDVSKHEPRVMGDGDAHLGCSCGWEWDGWNGEPTESYFDHISREVEG
jgi:hypothetical protein